MSTDGTGNLTRTEAELMADASVWLARLHGPNRTREVESGFRAWLAESPRHAAAFEHMTDTWEKAGRLWRRPSEKVSGWEFSGVRMRFPQALAAAAAVAIVAMLGTWALLQESAVSTAVGEQRILNLDDGSRIFLNTATTARVLYDKKFRRIRLEKGEALFEVAQRPDWPFIVEAGEREIRALGTSFVVRHDGEHLAVTLVDGKVQVSANGDEFSRAGKPGAAMRLSLSPGERLSVNGRREVQVDRPAIDKLTAWQRGQVILDNVPLADAVAEMNRYSRTQITVESSRATEIRISGIFRSGDSGNFARAVARSYGFAMSQDTNRIGLAD